MDVRSTLSRLLPWCLAVGILVAAVGLLKHAWFEVSSGSLTSDALIFQTVGRGILNGLKPYVDLFETKPPGIFLLHALSWKLFGGSALVNFVHAFAVLTIPFLTVIPVLRHLEQYTMIERRTISLLTVLFGLLLALYTANMSGFGYTESLVAALAIGYLVTVRAVSTPSPFRIVVLGLLLLAAAGIREPIVPVILAGLLLLAPRDSAAFRRFLVPNFLLPVIIAAVLGIAALAALGYLGPFFEIYLPHMLGFHVRQHNVPLLLRTFEVWRIFTNIGAYSWFFSVAVVSLWITALFFGGVRESRGSTVRFSGATLLTLLAIAIGGDFYGHHFVIAVPFYAALWWTAVEQGLFRRFHLAPLAAALLFIGSALFHTRLSFADDLRFWREQEQKFRPPAAVLDTVMDRCGWDRYLQMVPREAGPYAFTKHSPYGPIFIHYSRFIDGSPAYTDAYLQALQEAPVALILNLEDSNFTEYALRYVGSLYHEKPPSCAGADFVQPKPYTLLFRKD